MHVLAELCYYATVEVDIPDNLPEKEARSAAMEAVREAGANLLDMEWVSTTYSKPDTDNHIDPLTGDVEMVEWFDI